MNNRTLIMICMLPAWLAGCMSIPHDRGRAQALSMVHASSVAAADQQLHDLLNKPVNADAAVSIALNRNAEVKRWYAQLGMAQADVYDASRLSNPSLGFVRLTASQRDASRTTWSISQNFTELLFLHYRTQLGRSEVLQMQQRFAHAVLQLESSVRVAYYRYVTAKNIADLYQQVNAAAQAGALYAKSLFDAGNISELQWLRERVAAGETQTAWQQALNEAGRQRAILMTLMGVDDQATPVTIVEVLPSPDDHDDLNGSAGGNDNDNDNDDADADADADDIASLTALAGAQRMDVKALQEQVDMLRKQAAHVRRWFWLNDMQIQGESEHDVDGTLLRGGGGSIGVPLFNQGGGARLRARSQLEAAQAELAQLQLSIRNDVKAQITALVRAHHIVAEYRQTIVPSSERMVELTQQQHNYMLVGTLELLKTREEQLHAHRNYLMALGEYWQRRVELSQTIGGELPHQRNIKINDQVNDKDQGKDQSKDQGKEVSP